MGRAVRIAAAFWNDTSGIILPYVTIILIVIVGISVLALDGSRYMSLQTQLQQGADAIALAAAAELDHKSDSIDRANAAINGSSILGTQNSTWFGSGSDQYVTISNVRYLSSLPASDTASVEPYVLCVWTSCTPANAIAAKFVEITVTPVSMPTILPASVFGGNNTIAASASAVAGFPNQTVCDIPPVFMCNPYETAGMSDASATMALLSALDPNNPSYDSSVLRKEIKLLNDGAASPGHFGWLVPPDGDVGANNLQNWISVTHPKTCYSTTTVDLNTGAKQSALAGFNVRFDIGADATHAPDVNVRKGYVAQNNATTGNWCNARLDDNSAVPPAANTRAIAPPEDTSFPSGFMGNGQWNCLAYWTFNHLSAPAPIVKADGSLGVCGDSIATTLSRYDVYTYEIRNSLTGDWSRGTLANLYSPPPPYNNNKGEIGTAMCASPSNAVQGRRIIYTAIINCLANSALLSGGATADNVPVAGYAKFFMIQPVPTTGPASSRTLKGEMTGLVTNLDKVRIIDQVQLYR